MLCVPAARGSLNIVPCHHSDGRASARQFDIAIFPKHHDHKRSTPDIHTGQHQIYIHCGATTASQHLAASQTSCLLYCPLQQVVPNAPQTRQSKILYYDYLRVKHQTLPEKRPCVGQTCRLLENGMDRLAHRLDDQNCTGAGDRGRDHGLENTLPQTVPSMHNAQHTQYMYSILTPFNLRNLRGVELRKLGAKQARHAVVLFVASDGLDTLRDCLAVLVKDRVDGLADGTLRVVS